jgi:hypothetical protein
MEAFFKNQLSKKKNKTIVDNLYSKPPKDKQDDKITYPYLNKGYWQQCDLLFLPNDKGYIYCLVVVDVGNRKVDAQPLKTKTSVDVMKALKIIWKRKIIDKPKQLTTDMGTEFKGEVTKELDKLNVGINIALQGRHRQVALVERKNQTIGTLIHKFIVNNEFSTGNVSSSWVEALPIIIKTINEKVDEGIKQQIEKSQEYPVDENYKVNMLNENQKVRVLLDNPKSLQGDKLHGKFRKSDIRFDPKIRTIKYVLMKPNQPPLYLLDGNYGKLKVEKAGYTINQLQIVDDNEIKPQEPLVEVEDNRFQVEKIIGKKIVNKKVFYLIKWKGYKKSQATYEQYTKLKKEIPQLIKRYENSLLKKP